MGFNVEFELICCVLGEGCGVEVRFEFICSGLGEEVGVSVGVGVICCGLEVGISFIGFIGAGGSA